MAVENAVKVEPAGEFELKGHQAAFGSVQRDSRRIVTLARAISRRATGP
jgi:hypothetical protein